MAKTTDYDKIFSSEPINGDARRVVRKPSETRRQSYDYIKVRPVSASERQDRHFIDHTGARFGKVEVLGLSAKHAGQWVVRCVCGNVEGRHATVLDRRSGRKIPFRDQCQECRDIKVAAGAYRGARRKVVR